MTAASFSTEDIQRITSKAAECFRKGLVDDKQSEEIIRSCRRLLRNARKNLRGVGGSDTDAAASDIANLREADRMLSALLMPRGSDPSKRGAEFVAEKA
jgi:hypothetical protein